MSPNLYLIVVPLIRRNGQPMFNRRSFCNTFTLHPRMAAYTCSSTHAQGTAGTCVRSTALEARFIPPAPMFRTISGGVCGSGEVGALIAITSRVIRCGKCFEWRMRPFELAVARDAEEAGVEEFRI